MKKPENAGKKQAATRFKPGKSGNPAGKPKGTLNKATMAAQALLDGEAEGLTRRAIELALQGNMQALRLCLERLLPPRKERAVSLSLPDISTVDSLPKLTAALLSAVAAGELTVTEASGLSTLAANHGKIVETMELEKRIAALENKGGGK